MAESLSIRVREDLGRIDRAFNQLMADDVLWKSFLRDPNGVLISLGLHAPTSDEVNRRSNAIMFATLTNRELLKETADLAQRFFETLGERREAQTWRREFQDELMKGNVYNNVDYDMAFIKFMHSEPEIMKKRYSLAFNHINKLRLLSRVYSAEELDSYINECVEAFRRFDDDIKFPVLEEWDAHYGVGREFGFAAVAEVAFDFTAIVGVELLAIVTVAGMTRIDDLATPADPFLNPETSRKVHVLGQLMKMSSEMAIAAGLHLR